MKINVYTNNNTWASLNGSPHTHAQENINHVYRKTDKHAHIKLDFLVNTMASFALQRFTSG